ncbi:unnamed protein product [Tilletia laevis]|uniref:FAD-binding domain-containing protein n=2 Tax=Tilletia TaxID=13289 RepID=A0A177VDT4_9BASI|nr:hypothetical protein CF335_g3795 [Tilletia laevis]KAE8259841.1 hypothetical protein A4X03_0g3974 [Tilletia caries]CAD6969275.1 unnamed protein product [Tilletia controversa]CAD6886928.1 unnamed protein product [Tilletia caries]CAD6943116.1 unnamed protein product [Tilletia laevis]
MRSHTLARSAGAAAAVASARGAAPSAGRRAFSSAATATATATATSTCSHRQQPPARSRRAAQARRTLSTAAEVKEENAADITIVGGGVAGLALACALTRPSSAFSTLHNPPSIALIDAGNLDRLAHWPPTSASSPSASEQATAWENRTVSLSADNLAWFLSHSVGAAPFLRRDRTWDVRAMHVSDGLTGAAIEFGSDDNDDGAPSGEEPTHLSTMVEISNLQQALLKTLRQRAQEGQWQISILQNTKVESIVPSPSAEHEANNPDPWPLLTLSSSSQHQQLRTRLLIGADGHNSPVRQYAGIRTFGHDYNQRGLVGTLRCRPGTVGHTAHQRFLPSGPIAFLPMSPDAASMVWTLPSDIARALETVHRESASTNPALLANLINAAFRLPWHSIDYLFARIQSFLADSSSPSTTSGTTTARDWSWLQDAIDQRIRTTLFRPAAEVEALGGVPDDEYSASVGMGAGAHSGRTPAKIISVDGPSAASFPLTLRHAEAYTGASLRGPSPSAKVSPLDAFKPSVMLEGFMGAVGLLQGVGERRDLSHPLTDGHAAPPARSRTVLVGDAAHTVHPLAGQGLNQGLLDVRALSNALERAVWEEGADLGLAKSLGSGGYERERWAANALWASGIDKLGQLFWVGDAGRGYTGGLRGEHGGGVLRTGRGLLERALVWGRSTGLEVLNELGPIKERMVRGAGSPTQQHQSRP